MSNAIVRLTRHIYGCDVASGQVTRLLPGESYVLVSRHASRVRLNVTLAIDPTAFVSVSVDVCLLSEDGRLTRSQSIGDDAWEYVV